MRRRLPAAALTLALVAAIAPPGLVAAPPDRSHPPEPGPPRPLKLPPVQHLALASGLPVHLVEMHELPVATVLLVLKSGGAADPADKTGLASFTADMLDEGAGGRDALAIDDEVSFLGADLSTGASWDSTVVSLHVPVARLDPALVLMADVALRPDFPVKELERVRREALTSLLEARSDPHALASRALAEAVFGTHRYGRALGGDARTIAAFTREDLAAFHARAYRPETAALVVVGDVTGPLVLPLLEKRFGSWRASTAAAPAIAAPPLPVPAQLRRRSIWLVDKPGAAQSVLRAGRVGPPRRTPDWPVLQVANTLLGGSFTSRLNDSLREQHGWAYAAGSVFDARRNAGIFLAAADVQTSATAPALTELLAQVGSMRRPPQADEVTRARSYAAAGYAREFETTRQIAGKIAAQIAQELPDDTWATFVPKVLASSPQDVAAASRAWIDAEALAVVVVGDRATVEPALRAAGLAPTRTLTVEQLLGPPPKLPPP